MLAAFMAIVAAAHSAIVHGSVTLANLPNGGFVAGALMALIGVLKYMGAAFAGVGRFLNKSDRLLDRTTFAERMQPERSTAQLEGYEYLLIGICTTAIAGLVQLLMFAIT